MFIIFTHQIWSSWKFDAEDDDDDDFAVAAVYEDIIADWCN